MDFVRPELIPDPTVRRLSLYLRQLEQLQKNAQLTVNSKQLGGSLGLTDAQVRKDLAYFGTFGHPGVGYNVLELISRIKRILGTDKAWNVVLVGVGYLGKALLSYAGFAAKGMQLVAAFDSDPEKVGQVLSGHEVLPMTHIAEIINRHECRLAILTVPADVAQDVATDLVHAGIRGILNFSPTSLTVPPTVAVQAVDVALQLEQLTFQVSLNSMTRSGVRHP
ncbi:MAG: redox-sensing transcriptional repressor Rex [Burkholderiales bacterium]|nr:redox-sensing transcriptional repressor Rex [Phycisphaerae bacterium]